MLEILNELGMSKPEITAYTGLLERGRCKTGELCNYTKIHSSKIYSILNSLIEKGLVTFTTKNNIKFFEANPVETIKTLFEQKKEQLEKKEKQIFEIITNLKQFKLKEKTSATYNYYEGIAGIKAGWYKILEEMDKLPNKSLKVNAPLSEENLRLFGFYSEFHEERIKRKILYKMIAHKKKMQIIKKRKKTKLTEIRLKDLEGTCAWGIYGNLFFIQQTSSKKPFTIIINEPLIAQTFELLFDEIWDSLLEF